MRTTKRNAQIAGRSPLVGRSARTIMLCMFLVGGHSFGRGITNLYLHGEAKGGTLELVREAGFDNSEISVAIETKPGETAESVVQRLGEAIRESEWFSRWKEPAAARAEGNMLEIPTLPHGQIALRGTETGLGIPPAPTGLECEIDIDRPMGTLGGSIPAKDTTRSGSTLIHSPFEKSVERLTQ